MSGLRSWRETPLCRSTSKTRNGGTRSHWDKAWGVMPSFSAKASAVPAWRIALFSASSFSAMPNVKHSFNHKVKLWFIYKLKLAFIVLK
jgi:hypothetical protein